MNKRFTAFLLAAAWILVLSAGCQQKPARVYRVAYTTPKSAQMMENTNQAAGVSETAYGGSAEAGQYPVETAEASNTANAGGGETAASPAAAEVTNAVYVPTAEYLTAADVQAMGPVSQEYHVDAGDVLQLKIDQLLQLDREEVVAAEVDRLGQIYLPLLNHVPVAGLTCEQIRNELVLRLGKDYIREPKVDVSIKEYGSKKVMVMGMVRQPGAVALETDNATLLDVITKAGGITAGAGVDVEILRGAYDPAKEKDLPGGSAGGQSAAFGPATKRELVPVARLLAEDGGTVNPIIYPGDIVNVPLDGDGYIYLSGEVKQPGAKPFRRTLNLLQAMSCAGGPTRNAAEKKCKIIRRTADGGEQVLVVNLEDIKKGKEQNIVLAQNDTIVVPGDPVKIFFNGVNDLFRRGVFAGVRMEYDAAQDMGIPSDGGYGGGY